MKRLLLVLAAAPAAAAPPAHYAKLFVDGATFTYDVTLTTWGPELETIDTSKVPMKKWPRHVEKSVVTCKVSKVATIGTATASEIACDKDIDPKFDVAGVYVASAAGLHHWIGADFPQTEADITGLEPPLIAARPRPIATKKKEPFVEKTFFWVMHSVRQVAGAWCDATTLKGAAHDGTRRKCFGPAGITRGGDDVAGELHDLQYRLRK